MHALAYAHRPFLLVLKAIDYEYEDFAIISIHHIQKEVMMYHTYHTILELLYLYYGTVLCC